MRMRRGFTLIEVMITSAILVTLIAGVLSMMTDLVKMTSSEEKKDDQEAEAAQIFRMISEDMAATGWEFYGQTAADLSSQIATKYDRNIRYYPYVIQQSADSTSTAVVWGNIASKTGGLGDQFRRFARAYGQVSLINRSMDLKSKGEELFLGAIPVPTQFGLASDATRVFMATSFTSRSAREAAYDKSFVARSQELVFLRENNGSWNADARDNSSIIYFPEGDWVTQTTVGGVTAGRNHDALGVLRSTEFTLPPNSYLPAPSGADVRPPSTFYWDRPTAPAPLDGRPAPTKVPAAVNRATMLSTVTGSSLGTDLVQIRWDTMDDPSKYAIDMTKIGTPDFHQVLEAPAGGNIRVKQGYLREFTYAVIPSAVGTGALVRAFTRFKTTAPLAVGFADVGSVISRNDAEGIEVVVDRVLSHNVSRIVFDTYRTDETQTLKTNQVRVRLYLLGKGARAGTISAMRVESLFATRALNSSTDLAAINAVLTTTPQLTYLTTDETYFPH